MDAKEIVKREETLRAPQRAVYPANVLCRIANMGHFPVKQRTEPIALIEEVARPQIAMNQREADGLRRMFAQPAQQPGQHRMRLEPVPPKVIFPVINLCRHRVGRRIQPPCPPVEPVKFACCTGQIFAQRATACSGALEEIDCARLPLDPFQHDSRGTRDGSASIKCHRFGRADA